MCAAQLCFVLPIAVDVVLLSKHRPGNIIDPPAGFGASRPDIYRGTAFFWSGQRTVKVYGSLGTRAQSRRCPRTPSFSRAAVTRGQVVFGRRKQKTCVTRLEVLDSRGEQTSTSVHCGLKKENVLLMPVEDDASRGGFVYSTIETLSRAPASHMPCERLKCYTAHRTHPLNPQLFSLSSSYPIPATPATPLCPPQTPAPDSHTHRPSSRPPPQASSPTHPSPSLRAP